MKIEWKDLPEEIKEQFSDFYKVWNSVMDAKMETEIYDTDVEDFRGYLKSVEIDKEGYVISFCFDITEIKKEYSKRVVVAKELKGDLKRLYVNTKKEKL